MTPIEERVAKLEEAVFGDLDAPGRDAWKSTVGMFHGDPVMKEVLDQVRENRNRERSEAEDESGRDA